MTYTLTIRHDSFDSQVPLESRVPSIDPPVFDIPLTLYAPPVRDKHPDTFRIILARGRLIRIGKEDSTIFDLNARTVTVVRPKSRRYSVESFDEARRRFAELFQGWNNYLTAKYQAVVQKTGQTKQIEGQTAEEFRIIAISVSGDRRRVQGTSVYWMVPNPPSADLAAFQERWVRECDLPFPGMQATPAVGEISEFGAMANAALKLPGYPAAYVVESRPLPGAKRLFLEESKNVSPYPPSELTIRVTGTSFTGFASDAADPSLFTVPAGYKTNKSLRYMPD